MEFKKWFLTEAIEYVHENFTQFYRKWKNRFLKVENEIYEFDFDSLKQKLETFERGGENECSSRITNWADSAELLLNRIKRSIKIYTKPSEMAEMALDYNFNDILNYLEKNGTTFRLAQSMLEITKKDYYYEENYNSMFEMFDDKSPEDFVAYYCGEEAVQPFMESLNQMNKVITNLEKAINLMREFDKQMAIIANSKRRQYKRLFQGPNIKEEMPEHQPFEYLYHASSNIPAIMQQGFKTRNQLGGATGLGGGTSDFISFTANPKIAKKIASTLKTAVRIAKGELSFEDIIQKYKRFGLLDDKDIENSKGISSNIKEQAFNLFRHVLSNIETKGLGYNPFFAFANFEKFASTNINDIGIVKALIDMSKVEEYNPPEEEYRVPVEAISNVTKYAESGMPND